MIKLYHVLSIITINTILASCFKAEPLNAECDILEATVAVDQPEDIFFSAAHAKQQVGYADSVIVFSVRRKADLKALSVRFKLTKGATISPASGSVQDFSRGPVVYTVNSEDRLWHRRYSISFLPVVHTVSDTICFDFENYELERPSTKYYVWFQPQADGTLANDWATGNPGFRLSMSSATPQMYPTVPKADGHSGSCVQLTTRSTGPFGVLAGKRLAAGNLFLGSFDLSKALKDALKATLFGIPFDKKPIKFTGWYRYKPGEQFQDKGGRIVAGRTDSAAIYAVLYRNQDALAHPVVLHGDDILTNSHIVGIARLAEIPSADSWKPFEVPFNYTVQPDEAVLTARGYSLAVVFSSSHEGDKFEGAIGSELCIDEVRIICSREEE